VDLRAAFEHLMKNVFRIGKWIPELEALISSCLTTHRDKGAGELTSLICSLATMHLSMGPSFRKTDRLSWAPRAIIVELTPNQKIVDPMALIKHT
jgi:hypothetical protein